MKYIIAVMVFILGELLGLFVFFFIKKKYEWKRQNEVGEIENEEKSIKVFDIQTFKGILERTVIVIGLIHGFIHAITAFSALKLGTRLAEDQKSHISNDYFLIGNLTSLLLAMVDSIIIKSFW